MQPVNAHQAAMEQDLELWRADFAARHPDAEILHASFVRALRGAMPIKMERGLRWRHAMQGMLVGTRHGLWCEPALNLSLDHNGALSGFERYEPWALTYREVRTAEWLIYNAGAILHLEAAGQHVYLDVADPAAWATLPLVAAHRPLVLGTSLLTRFDRLYPYLWLIVIIASLIVTGFQLLR